MDITSDPAQRTQVEDGELVVLAGAGDRTAMAALLARHYDYVAKLCRRVLGNPHDAEDACQEALLSATRYIAAFNGRCAFRTWLHAISRNACLNVIRANKARAHTLDAEFGRGGDHGDDDDGEPPNPVGAYPDADSVVNRLQIDAALATLPKNVHDAVVLRFALDMEYAQISEVLDVPLGTVKTWLRRGRSQLMSILAESPDGGRGV